MNLSLGGLVQNYDEQQTLQSAVDYAVARNVLVVAAAGNCAQGGQGCGYPNPMFYPAACNGVFAVAASDHFDNWATYSNYKSYVSLAAPGGLAEDALLSTVPGGYGFKYGTSMATPLVSGAAALVWTMQPAASYQQVAAILKDTADKVGANPLTGQPLTYTNGRNDYFGYGRLNVGQAVRRAYPPTLTPITETQEFLLGGSMTQQTRLLTLINPSSQQVQWRATVVRGDSWLSIVPTSGIADVRQPRRPDVAGQFDRVGTRPVLWDGAGGASAGQHRLCEFRYRGATTYQQRPAPHIFAGYNSGLGSVGVV